MDRPTRFVTLRPTNDGSEQLGMVQSSCHHWSSVFNVFFRVFWKRIYSGERGRWLWGAGGHRYYAGLGVEDVKWGKQRFRTVEAQCAAQVLRAASAGGRK